MRKHARGRWLERTVAFGLGAVVLVGGLWSAVAPRSASATPRATTGTASRAPVPPVLTDTESSAEDIVDFALDRNRREIILAAGRLRESAQGPAAAALARAGLPSSKVADLRQRAHRVVDLARRGSFVDIALAANAISELMPELYAHFRGPVPPLILSLDYLDREVELRSIARQPARVEMAVTTLDRTWPRVRPKVVAAGGAREAEAYDRHLKAIRRIKKSDRRTMQAEAVRGLELVDELERVFTR